ncbi:MAG TPA: prepilin-type N-terminal cleavage/methylation domain-containing protein [Elusimicrobiota bacterium]|nr:prepilin-type N-terminal cleavage/methylation domain-containing protein [Elusimicrobiota bacterium]HMX93969.1 prepilin-type N-terminal cleavage/methylation domain-containing protein [Elusimicrobiota bacterium]HMZ26546.1 prepilin-type N-terminal cleavage/methylation domain-containing protein [Elusimicrobiota bacterium]HNA60071.1 prepilin-type N-terminal cleavage/methylation domain-containing protein [Elusimicrobiota bacterium]HNF58640.1 prepilin-type N-terminal cleavage/methylation domain-con
MRPRRGFTLIELMLVVAIIGLLAAIAIPKFANMVIKAKEASIKGKLGTLRSALSIYYADNEGIYPPSDYYLGIALTTGSRYLDSIPEISIPTVPDHVSARNIITSEMGYDWPNGVQGYYVWSYDYLNTPSFAISVVCSHTDSSRHTWSLW